MATRSVRSSSRTRRIKRLLLFAAVALCCMHGSAVQQAVHVDLTVSIKGLQHWLRPPWACNATLSSFSYQQTHGMVAGMVEELSKPGLSWAVGWDDLADLEQHTIGGNGRHAARIEDSATAGPLLKHFVAAINQAYDSNSRLGWDDISRGALPTVKAVAAWWSSEQLGPTSLKASVVTFASMERLQQLRAQCLHWRGPLSVAVYLPLLQVEPGQLSQRNREALRLAVLKVMHMAADLERHAATACQLSLVLVYELIREDAVMPLYPLNSMRNLARVQARTPLAVLLDVDLLPSRSLYTRLAQPQKARDLLRKAVGQKLVYIIPAFELTPEYDTLAWAEALAAAPSKVAVTRVMDIPIVQQFHGTNFARGHRLTRYQRWRSAVKDDYPTRYEVRCEPWVLGPSFLMPWSDERYRGWGNNKIQFVNSLHHAGFRFMVMHDAYTIHRPHAIATIMQKYTRLEDAAQSLKPYIDALWQEQVARLKARKPWKPSTSHQLEHILSKLSWWRGAANML